MSGPLHCAATGCNNPVRRHPGRIGRPPIYCCAACRPSASAERARITVEVSQHDIEDDVMASRYGWRVILRRGRHQVIIATAMGRFSADALATELRGFLGLSRQRGDAIE